jgi:hypothetical protein
MQSVIEKLTNNLVVAAFVPSVVFCTAALLIFQAQMPSTIMRGIVDIYQELGLFVVFVAFTISLFLVYLRELIYEVYKGGYFPASFSRFEKKRARNRMLQIQTLRARVQELQEAQSDSEREISLLKDQLYDFVSTYRSNYPFNERRVVSTRLGNILRAGEDCVALRYKLDPICIWPNLVQVLPASSYQQIETAFNQMSLLINSSLLSFCLSFACGVYALLMYTNQGLWSQEYVVVAGISLVLSYVFYAGSLPIAKYYARMYCSAFNLYRFEVLKQMRLALPQDSDTEASVWMAVSELLAVGTEFGELHFEYNHTEEPEE